jgi:CheY-like chemotaxis protein
MAKIIPLVPNWLASNVLRPAGSLNDGFQSKGTERILHHSGDSITSQLSSRNLARPQSDKRHVLIMDENVEILDILGQLLRDEAYAVTLSSNPLDVETTHRLCPDVIITEVVFQGAPVGLETISRLRADTHTRDIPIICCTLLPHFVENSAHAELPMVTKPFDLDEVLNAVASACGQTDSRDQPSALS